MAAAGTKQTATAEELWGIYRTQRDTQTRNLLLLCYGPLVRSISRHMDSLTHGYVERDDLESCGMIGLLKAIEKFDPDRGVTFETFAAYRIRGEMLDYVRRNDWVPRGVRKRAQDFEGILTKLMGELGHHPSEAEVAEALGVPENGVQHLYADLEQYNLLSLEELIQVSEPAAGGDNADEQSPEGYVQERELQHTLTGAIESMPERERLIVTLYYYEGFSQKEISGILGVSESRVCQLHARAIGMLKKAMQEYING